MINAAMRRKPAVAPRPMPALVPELRLSDHVRMADAVALADAVMEVGWGNTDWAEVDEAKSDRLVFRGLAKVETIEEVLSTESGEVATLRETESRVPVTNCLQAWEVRSVTLPAHVEASTGMVI